MDFSVHTGLRDAPKGLSSRRAQAVHHRYAVAVFRAPAEGRACRVTPYELIVNLKTALDIGVTMPPEVLKRADRVIQQVGE
jgi:hypothetical protein